MLQYAAYCILSCYLYNINSLKLKPKVSLDFARLNC